MTTPTSRLQSRIFSFNQNIANNMFCKKCTTREVLGIPSLMAAAALRTSLYVIVFGLSGSHH